MGKLLESMIVFFEHDNWPTRVLPDINVVQSQFQGENGQWVCYTQARENLNQVVFYSICPVVAPKDKLAQLAELITRINYDLIMGNFEMNYEDGQIRYKTSIDVEGDELSLSLSRNLVYANVYLMDEYLPGILKAIYTDEIPTNIIEQIEDKEVIPASINN